jgi:uncharacterized protein (TIGR02145 family)
MRRIHIFTMVFVVVIVLIACSESENEAPTILFISPSSNSSFTQGETITLTVEVNDPEDDMKEVCFYTNNVGFGNDRTSPYSFDWETDSLDEGDYTIMAEAIDNEGATGEVEITITLITSLGANEPGTVTDIDGNIYQTIQIGNQVWMAENLRVTHYRNGDPIQSDLWPSYWGSYVIYNNNANNEMDTYGVLYNFYSIVEWEEELAPEGWHIPSDDEWTELEVTLGMSPDDADEIGWRGTNEGSKLAGNANLWSGITPANLKRDPEFGTSGFNALPGGTGYYRGGFIWMSGACYFWSSSYSLEGHYSWYRNLESDRSGVNRSYTDRLFGFSIRCVRD